jgi:hypothetical protein
MSNESRQQVGRSRWRGLVGRGRWRVSWTRKVESKLDEEGGVLVGRGRWSVSWTRKVESVSWTVEQVLFAVWPSFAHPIPTTKQHPRLSTSHCPPSLCLTSLFYLTSWLLFVSHALLQRCLPSQLQPVPLLVHQLQPVPLLVHQLLPVPLLVHQQPKRPQQRRRNLSSRTTAKSSSGWLIDTGSGSNSSSGLIQPLNKFTCNLWSSLTTNQLYSPAITG